LSTIKFEFVTYLDQSIHKPYIYDMSERKILPVKSDVIFRMFFADERNVDLLTGFLKSVLRLPGLNCTIGRNS